MHKHINKLLAISVILFIFLLLIPGSFAMDNATALELDTSDETLTESQTDIYFNSSQSEDGDGSLSNPYNSMDASRLRSNSNIHLEEGVYSFSAENLNLSNVNIYGKNAQSTLIDATSLARGLSVINTNGFFTISNVTFVNIHFNVNGRMNLYNSIFDKNTTKIYTEGGVIYAGNGYASSISINNCRFHDYSSNMGGAILVENGILKISNSEFANCNAYWPYNENHGQGGAIFMDDGNLEIYNSSFSSCNALGLASAIYAHLSEATVQNCIFEGNVAYNGGGALVSEESNTEISGCIFKNNSAKFGGAIYNHLGSVSLQDSVFEMNSAGVAGGAIFNHETSLSIGNSKFRTNRAESFGGAVASYYACDVTVNDTSFEGEFSSHIGGAISSENSRLELNHVNFTKCAADFGSAVVGLISDTRMNDVAADNNSAVYEGGALYQIYGTLSIADSRFSANAAGEGGALYLDYVDVKSFKSNIFKDNRATEGSAYYLLGVDGDNFTDNTLINNEAFFRASRELFIGNGNYTLIRLNDTFDGILPERYNLADYGFVTPVKDQGEGGYCWAFTTMAVLESCIAKAGGLHYDFSENNLINLNKLFSDYGLSTVDQGGSIINALGYLLSWLGPVNDTYDEYSPFTRISPVLDSEVHVQNVLFIDVKNQTDLNPIKEAIMRYGAVGTFLHWDDSQAYQKFSSYYYDGSGTSINHAVTIVGWDDNYAKENFATEPPANGAWIVKNSWGPYMGDHGYFYVSYYSGSINDAFSSSSNTLNKLYTFIMNDTVRFDKNYQYDFAGVTRYYTEYSQEAWLKNVFTSTDDEFLAGVSTYFMQESEYDICIYVNGEMIHNQSGVTKSGYYTFNLDTFIPLKRNDVFEVVFHMRALDDSGITIVTSRADDVTQSNYASGISFYCDIRDKWMDLGSDEVLCIKAFTILDKINTTMDLEADYDGYNPVTVKATIFDENNTKVTAGRVTFSIEGENYEVDVVDGAASFIHNFRRGESEITATFFAENYNPIRKSIIVNVSRIDVDVALEVSTHLNAAQVNITTSQLINESIEVNVNNRTYSINLSNGKATLRLDSLENGRHDINARIISNLYEGENACNFSIEFKRSSIISGDLVCFENADAVYSVRLLGENSTPLSGRTVIFTLNGKDTEALTDGNGEASLTVNLAGGNYEIISRFDGDDLYLAANASNSIKVKSSLSANVSVTKNYNNVSIDIVLSKQVDMKLFVCVGIKKQVINAINGRANLIISNLENGNYTVEVYQEGDDYDFANAFHDFSINVTKLRIVSSDFTTTENSRDFYTVKLIDENGFPVAGRIIVFNLNGKKYSAVSDDGGEARLMINLAGGTYAITSSFEGDGMAMPVSASNTIIVKSPISASVDVTCYCNNATIDITLSRNVNIDLNLCINGENHTASAVNGKANLKLSNLSNGNYNVHVTVNDDAYSLDDAGASFNISVAKSVIVTDDFVAVEKTASVYTILLADEKGLPISSRPIIFDLNGKTYDAMTDADGFATLKFNLAGGNYEVTSTFSGDNQYLPISSSNSIKVKYNITSHININRTGNSAEIRVDLSDRLNHEIILSINGENKTVNSKDIIVLDNLENGKYTVEVYLDNEDYVLTSHPVSFSINLVETSLFASDLTTYYGSEDQFTVKLADDKGNGISGKTVRFTINNRTLEAESDKDGFASIPIDLEVGDYEINAEFEGDGQYGDSYSAAEISVQTTITLPEGTFASNATYPIELLTKEGAKLANAKVSAVIDGKAREIVSDKNGIANLVIDLSEGKHVIELTNPQTGEVKKQSINVVSRFSENSDIVMYYGADTTFKVRVFDDVGNVAKGVDVVIYVGDKLNLVTTDSNGYASAEITQKPGDYTITTSYGKSKVTNRLTVKTTLITKNVKVKKGKAIKFTAKVLNSQGKILKNKKVKFKINKKTYKVKTNKKGIATLKISKKLKAGKYKIKTKYGSLTVSNKITVKK